MNIPQGCCCFLEQLLNNRVKNHPEEDHLVSRVPRNTSNRTDSTLQKDSKRNIYKKRKNPLSYLNMYPTPLLFHYNVLFHYSPGIPIWPANKFFSTVSSLICRQISPFPQHEIQYLSVMRENLFHLCPN